MHRRTESPRPQPLAGLGAIPRRLAGVQESVLAQVPGERARYTSMGGVMLCTATVATISMAVAMHAVFGSLASLAAIAFTLIWGLFILSLDRWLISTIVTEEGWARFAKFLPRIILAVVFGVVIAEPLLLGVFNSAIETRVRHDRQQEVVRLEYELHRCNPPTGPSGRPADCVGGLAIGVDPDATQGALDNARRSADGLATRVAKDNATYQRLQEAAQNECAGAPGPGLTGQRGYGQQCRDRWGQAAEFRRINRLEQNNAELARLLAEVENLQAQLHIDRARYVAEINGQIKKKVEGFRSAQRQIGLLERFRALSDLVSENGYVHGTEWALRVFFVVLDSLPVLVKLLSGTTAYDRVAAGRLGRQERAQELALGTAAYRDAVEAGLRRYQIDLEATAERSRASLRARSVNRNTEEELSRIIDESADSRGVPAAYVPYPSGSRRR